MARRRQHGEGSLYHRSGDGRWVATVNEGYKNNVRQRRVFTGATPEEAMKKRTVYLDRKRDGFTVPRGRSATVAQWCEHWLVNIAQPRVEPTTFYGSYESKVRDHILPFFANTLLIELAEEDIESFHRHLGRTLSAASIVQVHRILSSAIKSAVVRGRIARNPVSNVAPPGIDRDEPDPPTAEETARILARCATWDFGARWILGITSGARQGEILALRWSDVDLAEPASITIRRTAARVRGKLTYKQPKSRKSRRTVQIGPATVAALKAWRKAQMERQMAAPAWEDSDLVFTLPHNGRPVYPRWDYLNWHALLDDLGIRHYRVHDLRHGAATSLLEAGLQPRVVQEVMGHASVAFTMAAYAHVRPVLHAAAAEAMDRIVRGS